MAVLVGIDEAGFGPILGPLVVSSTTFLSDADYPPADLWAVLRKSVAKSKSHLAGRLLILDSKKAYSRSQGIKHLERTVLCCLSCLGKKPQTLSELLTVLCPDCLARLANYPWHQAIASHTIAADTADAAIASRVFADDMAAESIQLLDIQSCCLDVEYYNNRVAAVRNKASVLFTAVAALIKRAWDNLSQERLAVFVDRLGGRMRYVDCLKMMFPSLHLRILTESPKVSSYELTAGNKTMHLHFLVGADACIFPVALASMVSKYLRELMIESINRYFLALNPNLKPTAGYYKDGLRFIEDLRTKLPQLTYDANQLIRSR